MKNIQVKIKDQSRMHVTEINDAMDFLNREAIYRQIVGNNDKDTDLSFSNSLPIYLVARYASEKLSDDISAYLERELGYKFSHSSLAGRCFINAKGHEAFLGQHIVYMTHLIPGLTCSLVNVNATNELLLILGIEKMKMIHHHMYITSRGLDKTGIYKLLTMPNHECKMVNDPSSERVDSILRWVNRNNLKLKSMHALLKKHGYILTNEKDAIPFVKYRKVINSETDELAFVWLYIQDNAISRMVITHAIPGLLYTIRDDRIYVLKIME